MIRSAAVAGLLLLLPAPRQDVPAPPAGPFTPVTKLMDAQNKVAAIDFLLKNNFYIPASTIEELQREEHEAFDETGSDGTAYDFSTISDAIDGQAKAEEEKKDEILGIVSQWMHKAVEQGAEQVELQRWFDSWRAEFDKGQGLKALMVARRFAELEKAKPALNLHQVLTSIGTVYGGRKAEAMKGTNNLVKYLVAVEKHRESLRRQLQMIQFVKTGLKTVEFMNDPVGEISKKAKEMITETAEEKGYDKETVEFVMKTAESIIKNAAEVYAKWEAQRLDTKVNIPDSVRRTARGLAVGGACFKVFKDLVENDLNKPYLSVLDFYIEALDLPWQFAQKMAEFMRKADQLEVGWRGIGVWKKILDENGEIELDPVPEEFGVKVARTSNVPEATAVWYLGLADDKYAKLSFEERNRLVRVLVAERMINAWYDGSEWFWTRWWNKAGRLNPWKYAEWVEAMIDTETYSDKDRASFLEKVRKVARPTGLTPEAQESLARNRATEIPVKGKATKLTPEELFERADDTLRELGTAEFIRESLSQVPKDAKHSYGWFRHALSSSGLAFDRKQLLKLFNNFVATGSDHAKFAETLKKVREDRAYANLEFGIPRMLVGGNDSVKRGQNPTLQLSLAVEGLPAKFEAPGRIRWEGPEGVEMPGPAEVKLSNGVRKLSFKIRIGDKVAHREQRIVARLEVPLPRGEKAEAWREWFFDVADAPDPPKPVKVRAVERGTAVEFKTDAVKNLLPNDRPLNFRLYQAPSPMGPWNKTVDLSLYPGREIVKAEQQKDWVVQTGPDTAAIMDGRPGPYLEAPSYFRVAQVLGERGSKQKEISSEPHAPSAPQIVIDYDWKKIPEEGLTLKENHRSLYAWMRLAVEDQNVSYAGCKFTITVGKATWHSWSGRKDGPRTMGFLQPPRALLNVPLPMGETNIQITAESREGVKASRTLLVKVAPPDAEAILKKGMMAVEEHVQVAREIPRMREYYEQQTEYKRKKLVELETKYKDKNDLNYKKERCSYLMGLNWDASQVEGLDYRLSAMRDIAQYARAAGLFDRALELQKKIIDEIPNAEKRDLDRRKKALAIQVAEGPPDPTEVQNQQNGIVASEKGWKFTLTNELNAGRQDARAAGDLASFHVWTQKVIELDPEGAYSRNYVTELANAHADLGGNREEAQRWYIRYLQLKAATSPDPKRVMDEQNTSNLPAWWPDPKVADRPKPLALPRPEPKKPEAKKPEEPVKPPDPPKPVEPKPEEKKPVVVAEPPKPKPLVPTPEPPKPEPPKPPPPPPSPPAALPAAAASAVAEGDAALQRKDVTSAIRSYGKAVDLAPSAAGPRLKRAEANLILGKFDEAIADLAEERKLGDRPAVAVAWADALLSTGKPDDALRELEKAGADAPALAMRGRALLAKGDRPGAAARFAEAAKLDPRLGETIYASAGLSLEKGAYGRALPLYDAVEGLLPAKAGAHYGRATALTGLGRKDEAVRSYSRYLDFDSTSSWAGNARTNALALLGGAGNAANANKTYQQAVSSWQKGDVAAALASYDRAILQDRACYRAYVGRGLARAFLGQHPEAVGDYLTAQLLTVAPGDIPVETVALYRVEALVLGGRVGEADQLLRGFEGRTAAAHGLRGMILLKRGDRAAAARSFGQARAMDGNLPQFYYASAGSRLQHRNFHDALMYCDGLELLDSSIGSVHYSRGSALAGLGKKDEAVAAFNKYLEFDSRSEWATRARQAIAELKR